MYQINNENYSDAIAGPNRIFDVRFLCNDEVLVDSVKSFTTTSGSEEITIGSAISSYIQATIESVDVSLSGKEVTLEVGIEIDGEIEYVPMGVYTIQNPVKESNKITFTAYDRLASKCNGAYFSKLSYPTDALNILSEICLMTGIAVDTTGMQTGILINQRAVIDDGYDEETEEDTVITTYVNPFDGYTYKETIGFIAGLYGRFAVCDRTGKVKFPWYQDISYNIPSSIFYNDLQESEEAFSVGQLTCSNADQTISAGDGATGISMQNPVMTQDILNSVYDNVKGLAYTPATLRFVGDPRLDVGDIVTAEKNDGTKIMIPIISLITSYDGGLMQTIASYGSTVEEDDSDTKGPITEMAERVEYELAFVKTLMAQNISATNATIKKLSGDVLNFKTGEFENLKADVANFKDATTTNLTASNAEIENLKSTTVKVSDLDAKVAALNYLKASDARLTYATIKDLEASNARIATLESDTLKTKNLEAEVAKFGYLKADRLETEVGKFGYLKSYDAGLTYATIENLNATNTTIKNLKSDQATFETATAENFEAANAKIETLESDTVKAKDLEAKVGTFGYLKSKDLESEVGKFGYLKVDDAKLTYATIDGLKASNATIEDLQSDYATFKTATANDIKAANANIQNLTTSKATVEDLNAATAKISVLDGNYANLNTLVNGNLTSANIQNLTLTSKNTTIENGMIKNAMIDNLAFDKITGIDINTTNLTVHSNDGKSKWADNTIQISDANRVRVQIGKDASNDYSMSVWDKNGNLIWDALGATDKTIQRKIIRDDVVADNANISGSKLDINSVIKEVNGSTTKLKSSVINMDDKNQTLDVVFNEMETTVANNLSSAKVYADGKMSDAQKYALEQANSALSNAKSYTNSAVDGIQVGGRNLLLKSKELNNTYYVNDYPKSGEIFKGYQVRKSSGAWNAIRPRFNATVTKRNVVKAGDVLTYSIYAKTDDTSKISILMFNRRVDDTTGQADIRGSQGGFKLTNAWKLYSVTFTVTESMLSDDKGITYFGYESCQKCTSGKYVYWACPKLEYGNKATDYTPAPEDTDNKIDNITEITTSHTTSINTMQGQISTLISDTKTINGKYDTVTNNYNSLKQTVDSNTRTIGEHTSSITGIKSNITTIEENLNGVTTRVSAAEENFNNLEIGGRNLLTKDDNDMSKWTNHKPEWIKISNNEYNNTLSYSTLGGGWENVSKKISVTKDQKYTLSFEYKVNKAYDYYSTYKYGVYVSTASPGVAQPANIVTDASYTIENTVTDLKRGSLTFTAPSDVLYIVINGGCINDGQTGLSFEFNKWKLEKSTKATDYTPAPEDTDTRINSAETKAEQTATKFSWLVKSGTSSSNFELTDRTATLVANTINLNGLVTFSGLDSSARDKINTVTSGNLITVTPANPKSDYEDVSYSIDTDDHGGKCIRWNAGCKKYLVFTNYAPITFNSNDKLYYSITVPNWSSTTFTTSLCVWLYGKNKEDIATSSVSVTLKATTWNRLTGYLPLPSTSTWGGAYYYNIGLKNSNGYEIGLTSDSYIEKVNSYATTYSKDAVDWVSQNGVNTNNMYSMVSKWASDAISDTTTINGGWIATNTITANKIAIGDFTNYCQLNENSAAELGFDVDKDSDDIWFSPTEQREYTFMDFGIDCIGGEEFYVEYDIHTNVESSDGSDGTSMDFTSVGLAVMMIGADNSLVDTVRVGMVKSSANESLVQHVTDKFVVNTKARKFNVCLYTEGKVFSGTTMIKNVSIRRKTEGNLIVDGAITANKIAANTITANSAIIADGAITNAKIQSIDASKITTGQLIADRIDVNGIFAKDITATGKISGLKLSAATGEFSGKITAKEGTIGKYTITDSYLISGEGETCTGIGGDQAFWAGLRSPNDAPFRVSYAGQMYAKGATLDNATVSGKITATEGEIAGWTIKDNKMYSGDETSSYAGIGKNGTACAFWAGASSPLNSANAPFRVEHDGSMTATKGKIGRYDITDTYLKTNTGSNATGIGGDQAFWAGSEDSSSAPFRVSYDGSIVSTKGQIGRYDITDAYLKTGSGSSCTGIGGDQAFWAGNESSNSAPFRVGYDGALIAENATIYGSITTGNIGDEGDVLKAINGHLTIQGTANDTNIYSTWFKFGIGGDYYLKSTSDGVECYRNMYATDFIASGWIYNSGDGHYTWKDKWDTYISSGNYNGSNNIYYYAGYHAFYVNGDSGNGMMYIETSGVSSRKGFRNSSDERIKKNFKSFDDDFINDYMRLEPVKYQFKDDDDKYHIGFKAQNVDNVLNTYGKEHNEQFGICDAHHVDSEYAEKAYGVKNMNEIYTLAYDEIIGANTFMIQKTRKDLLYQAGRIDIQEAIINDLQFKIVKMEKKIEQLTKALA